MPWIMMNHVSKEHLNSMSNVFEEMLDCGMFSDVILLVGTKRLKCHKIILSAASDYFRNMFSLPMKESSQSEIKLPGVDEDLIEDLLKYLYTGHIRLTCENVKSLLCVADMMCLEDLKNVCCTFLTSNVNAYNCLELWILGNEMNTNTLLEKSWRYCLENFEAVVNSESFPFLTLHLVQKYIRDKELCITSEEQAATAILKWVSFENQIYLRQALDAVRLEYLSPGFIKTVLLEDPAVKSQTETRKYVYSVLDHVTLNTSVPESLPTFEHRLHTEHCPGLFILGGLSDSLNAESQNCHEVTKVKIAFLGGVDYNGFGERNRKVPTRLKDSMKLISCCSLRNIVYLTGVHKFERQLWQYNVTSNSWSSTESFTISRSGHNLICGYGDLIYALSGSGVTNTDDTTKIECVITSKNSHTREVGKLLFCVYNAASVFYDGKIYVLGGFDVGGKGTERMLNKIQMFDTVNHNTTLLAIRIPIPTDVLLCRTNAVQHRGYIIVMIDYGKFWVTRFSCLMKSVNKVSEIAGCLVDNGSIQDSEPCECGCCKVINLPLDVNEDICNIEVLDDMFVVVTGDFEYTTGKIYKTQIQEFLSGDMDLKWVKSLRFKESLRPYQICKVFFGVSYGL